MIYIMSLAGIPGENTSTQDTPAKCWSMWWQEARRDNLDLHYVNAMHMDGLVR